MERGFHTQLLAMLINIEAVPYNLLRDIPSSMCIVVCSRSRFASDLARSASMLMSIGNVLAVLLRGRPSDLLNFPNADEHRKRVRGPAAPTT